MSLQPIDFMTLTPDVFSDFVTKNALLTAGDKTGYNTMTIGWGQLGSIWNVPVCTVYVRPERYTYAFMEKSGYFTVSIIPSDRRDIARICGSKSGREVDKAAQCGLTVAYGEGDAPYFEEAELVLVCKKLYRAPILEEGFFYKETVEDNYPNRDFHDLYIGQIVKVLVPEGE